MIFVILFIDKIYLIRYNKFYLLLII